MLHSIVCDEGPSSAKQVQLDDTDSENEDEPEPEPEPESSTITTYDEALHVANDLLLFLTQHSEEQLSGIIFKVVTKLQSIKLKQSMTLKLSNILQYFS